MYMARKSAQEMIDYSNKLAGIEVESILERERNWYGKTKQVEYRLINGDIKSEMFFTSKSISIITKMCSIISSSLIIIRCKI